MLDSTCPRLLLTLGDPGGLGPELVCRSERVREHGGRTGGLLVLVGPEAPLAASAARFMIPRFWRRIDDLESLRAGVRAQASDRHPVLLFVPQKLRDFGAAATPGQPSVAGGLAAGASLNAALDLLLKTDLGFGGIVTAPLDKAMLKAAGYDFPGHTEFLAIRSGLAPDAVTMHLCGPASDPQALRVSLVTTHPPLAEVPRLVTPERVERAVHHTVTFAARLGLAAPVAVCGLNPHAGETGTIGREEIEVIGPVLDRLRGEGLKVEGPFPADTVFHRARKGDFSAVVAMYHDQGLGPLKLAHFGKSVNVTLGLPFVRTSVDHGTGYDLVGTGRADVSSLNAAVELAARLAGETASVAAG